MSDLDKHRSAIAQIFRDEEGLRCLGTGFLISPQGHVLTCWHVVVDKDALPQQVFVRFADQERIRVAAVLAQYADPVLDYVVVRVEGPVQEPIPIDSGSADGAFFSFGFRKNELAAGLEAPGIPGHFHQTQTPRHSPIATSVGGHRQGHERSPRLE